MRSAPYALQIQRGQSVSDYGPIPRSCTLLLVSWVPAFLRDLSLPFPHWLFSLRGDRLMNAKSLLAIPVDFWQDSGMDGQHPEPSSIGAVIGDVDGLEIK